MKAVLQIFCLLVLTSCATPALNIEPAKVTSFPNDPFKETLRVGYISLAEAEFQRKDYDDAKLYSRKAMALVRGLEPDPENLYNREINLTDLNELLGARYFIESAFVKGVKDMVPVEAARAQLMFDCWADSAEEGNGKYGKDKNGVNICKTQFEEANVAMVGALDEIKRREEEVARREDERNKQMMIRKLAEQKASLRKMPDPSFIFFKFNSTRLGITGESILEKVARDIEYFKPSKVVISGNADRVGDYNTNMKLAMERGKVVERYLVEKFGVSPALLDVKAYGENNPRKNPDREVKDVRNRYVSVIFLKEDRTYYENAR